MTIDNAESKAENSTAVSAEKRVVRLGGESLLLNLVKMGEEEGMLISEVVSCFGVGQATIWNHIKNHKLRYLKFSSTELKNLKSQGVIGKSTTRAAFLPKESLRWLTKFVHTVQAFEVFRQLWEIADIAYEHHTSGASSSSGSEFRAIHDKFDKLIDAMNSQPPVVVNVNNSNSESSENLKGDPFPSHCMRTNEIATTYFDGISERRVTQYLQKINHPTAYFNKVTEHYQGPAFAYVKEGLDRAAEAFKKQTKILSDGPKTKMCKHPCIAGTFQIRKD